MNANELADWLDKQAIVSFTGYFHEPLELAADMLRQQQAEIEALKAKTLTDEEINAIGLQTLKDTASFNWGQDALHEFARAILKKASEK